MNSNCQLRHKSRSCPGQQNQAVKTKSNSGEALCDAEEYYDTFSEKYAIDYDNWEYSFFRYIHNSIIIFLFVARKVLF